MSDSLRKPRTMTRRLYQRAIIDSFIKLNPRVQVRNPVMFVVEVGSVLTTGLWIQSLVGNGESYSPISPKPWQKAAAKHKRTLYAVPARRPMPKSWRKARSKASSLKRIL
jgi:hypothetical protein